MGELSAQCCACTDKLTFRLRFTSCSGRQVLLGIGVAIALRRPPAPGAGTVNARFVVCIVGSSHDGSGQAGPGKGGKCETGDPSLSVVGDYIYTPLGAGVHEARIFCPGAARRVEVCMAAPTCPKRCLESERSLHSGRCVSQMTSHTHAAWPRVPRRMLHALIAGAGGESRKSTVIGADRSPYLSDLSFPRNHVPPQDNVRTGHFLEE